MSAMRELFPEEIYLLNRIEDTAGHPLSDKDRHEVLKGFEKHNPRFKLQEKIAESTRESRTCHGALLALASYQDLEWLLTSDNDLFRKAGKHWTEMKESIVQAYPDLVKFPGSVRDLMVEFNKREAVSYAKQTSPNWGLKGKALIRGILP